MTCKDNACQTQAVKIVPQADGRQEVHCSVCERELAHDCLPAMRCYKTPPTDPMHGNQHRFDDPKNQ